LLTDTQAQRIEEATFIVLDTETTGMKPPEDRVIEIAAIRWKGGRVQEEFETLIDPGVVVPPFISGMTGITTAMLAGQPCPAEVWSRFDAFCRGADVLVAQNAPFDRRFVHSEYTLAGLPLPALPWLCTVRLARRFVPKGTSCGLDSLANHFGLSFDARHRALGDCRVTTQVLHALVNQAYLACQATTLGELHAVANAGFKENKSRWNSAI